MQMQMQRQSAYRAQCPARACAFCVPRQTRGTGAAPRPPPASRGGRAWRCSSREQAEKRGSWGSSKSLARDGRVEAQGGTPELWHGLQCSHGVAAVFTRAAAVCSRNSPECRRRRQQLALEVRVGAPADPAARGCLHLLPQVSQIGWAGVDHAVDAARRSVAAGLANRGGLQAGEDKDGAQARSSSCVWMRGPRCGGH